jgi:transcriptional regulator with XRE-family HTH domain
MKNYINLDPAEIRREIEAAGVSIRTLAAQLDISRPHLTRVLRGRRAGSRELLQSVANLVATFPRRSGRRSRDVHRLIDAATHVFFLSRGDFESEICSPTWPRLPVAAAGGLIDFTKGESTTNHH